MFQELLVVASWNRSQEQQTRVLLDLRNVQAVNEVVVRIIIDTMEESKRIKGHFVICEMQKR